MQTGLDKIIAARTNLIIDSPFFGVIMMMMKVKETDAPFVMCTDGRDVFYNEKMTQELNNLQVRGVLVHEVYHIILKHHLRLGSRNPKLFNIASDYVINLLVRDAGFTLPDWVLYDTKYRGMDSETVYSLLEQQASKDETMVDRLMESVIGWVDQAKGGGSKSQQPGASAASPGEGECGGLADELLLNSTITMAAAVAKKAGKLPAGLEHLIEELLEPKADWETILAQFVDSYAKNDFSFRKLSRSGMQRSMIIPGMLSDDIGNVLVVMDLSGSIGEQERNEELAEVFGILDRYDVNLTLATADTEIYMVGQWEKGELPDPAEMVFPGGGGTSLDKLIEWVDEHGLNPRFCLYLTDGYLDGWGDRPEFPLLVGVLPGGTTSSIPDWAQIIEIK